MARTSAIGLDIGTSGVRAAQLSFAKSGLVLEKFAHAPLPAGAVRDGEVVDPAAVAAVIKDMWATARFSSKKVVLGVANHRVIVRQVEVPAIPLADLPAALPFQVQDLLPMPVDSAVLDFHPLAEVTGADGQRMLRGLLVAAHRDMVMDAVRCAEAAGLTTTSVDLTSFAVLRSLGSRLDVDVRAEALVDIGAHVTNVIVHAAGVPRFVRILLRGGQDITDAVAERMGLTPEVAEILKRGATVRSAPAPTPFGTPAEAAEAVTEPADIVSQGVADGAQSLIDELRGSLDYYASTHPDEPVDRVVVSGGGSLLRGLADRLAAATRLPVVAGNPFAAVDVSGAGLGESQLAGLSSLAAVPVGLALGAAR